MVRLMAKEFTNGQVVTNMMVSGKITRGMEEEYTNGRMVPYNMMVNGKMTRKMAEEYTNLVIS